MRETSRKTLADRVTDIHHDDWDLGGRILRRQRAGRRYRNDHVHLEADQLPREPGQAFHLTICEAPFDDQVPAFDVTEFAHCRPERAEVSILVDIQDIARAKETDTPNFAWLLGECGERRGAQRDESKQRVPSIHLIPFRLPRQCASTGISRRRCQSTQVESQSTLERPQQGNATVGLGSRTARWSCLPRPAGVSSEADGGGHRLPPSMPAGRGDAFAGNVRKASDHRTVRTPVPPDKPRLAKITGIASLYLA